MTVHTFHLATTKVATAMRSMAGASPTAAGLRHAECMTTMPLGVSLLSPARLRPRHFAMFAAFALAATRPPRTAATFSVWRTEREMVEMVTGSVEIDGARRHADAMAARERKDFHREFTTLRFRPISEHGAWGERARIIPTPAL